GKLGDLREADAVVEGSRELDVGVEQEALTLLDPLPVVDVGGSTDPEVDRTARSAHRHRTPQVPAVAPVGGAETELALEDLTGRERPLAPLERLDDLVGMDELDPRSQHAALQRRTRVLSEAAV